MGTWRHMKVVKGSKQHRMVVVPYRPWYRLGAFGLGMLMIAALVWSSYEFGVSRGMDSRVQVAHERDRIKQELRQSKSLIESQKQQIADLKVGNKVDTKANEEVRQTIASLQSKIADLSEQIAFYKAVMSPDAEGKGLRIERFQIKPTDQPQQYHYSLLLIQIVDKHNYIDGDVDIRLEGTQNDKPETIALNKLSPDANGNMKFRFRYFQDIDGDLTIPAGFTPKQFVVVARSSGRHGQRLEKKFQWHTGEG